MNTAKMWLVVKPTVGVPLFLTAVAVGSFAVHVAVLSNTTWVSDFLSGKPLGSAGMASLTVTEPEVAKVSFTPSGAQTVLVTLPDGTVMQAVLQLPETVAALK